MKRAPSPPFLLIDAGNSRIKWALADAPGVFSGQGVFSHENGNGNRNDSVPPPGAATSLTAEPDWSSLPHPGGAWISNVAGAEAAVRIDALIERHWPALPRTTIRARDRQCGVTNGYAEPGRLGSDRWAGLVGAHAAFPGEDLLIATLGTATTLEALDADGTFEGGLIAPGWTLMMRSLGEHTAQLPTLAADSASALAGDALARRWLATDTRQAISAGSLLAQVGLIEQAWREFSRPRKAPTRLVLGGGAADAVARALSVPCTRHDGLVISGLALIAADDARLL
jgi:type III pantothenate kinase